MTTLDVRIFGDPVLRQRALEVEDFDGGLARLATDLFDTMRAAEGVGLAANQVGVLRRVFTFEVPEHEGRAASSGAVVNPVLLGRSDDEQDGDEGCLSFPGLFYPLRRPLTVEVSHRDLDGELHEVELTGFLARVWLHEMDHLDGVLFIDHLAKHDRAEAMRLMRELHEEADLAPPSSGLLRGRAGPV
jgi:peptide deformylase